MSVRVQGLAGKTALVTGASGFIGTHLCRQLSSAGASVHAVSRTPQEGTSGPSRWHLLDMREMAAVRAVVREVKPDVIFHLAGLALGARDLTAVRPTFEHNLMSTLNVLEAVTETGCGRLVLAGSLEEPDASNIDVAPSSPYAASKWAASAYGRLFHALYRTPVVLARVFMVYGPEQRDLNKIIPYAALAMLREESPTFSSGARPVDWIYVDDVVEGLLTLATTSSIEGQTVDLGSGQLVTVRAAVEQLAELVRSSSVPVFGALPDRPFEQVRAANVELTFSRIGWRASTPLKDGLAQTVDWCRNLLASRATM